MPAITKETTDAADKAATLAGELTRLADKLLDVTCDVQDGLACGGALELPANLPPLDPLRETVREWLRATDLAQLEQVLTYLMTFEA